MVAKKKSKFDNKFKSTTPADCRTANVRTERKVKDDLPKLSRSIFKKLSCNFRRKVLQTNDRSVSCRICFPSGVHSFESPMVFILFTP